MLVCHEINQAGVGTEAEIERMRENHHPFHKQRVIFEDAFMLRHRNSVQKHQRRELCSGWLE